jgi:CheY-like chemotaxis protein
LLLVFAPFPLPLQLPTNKCSPLPTLTPQLTDFEIMPTLSYKCYGRTSRRKLSLGRFASSKQSEDAYINGRDSNRILVVDDEPEICRLNSDVLMDIGYDVDLARDGIAAWNLLEQNEYELMITDNRMPRMSGVELLKKLHNARRFVPAIMTTGTLPEEQVSYQPWFQLVTTLIKPYTLGELLTAVKRSIRNPARVYLPT